MVTIWPFGSRPNNSFKPKTNRCAIVFGLIQALGAMESSQNVPTKSMAVVCSLAELPDGSLRVVLDDARKSQAPGNWACHSLFTFKDFAPGALEDLAALPESELANFGYYVLARLLVSNGHGT